MFLRFEATMSGTSKFSEIAPEVVLRDIVEQPAEMDVTTSRKADRPGEIVTAQTRTSLSVKLIYVIRAKNIERRAEVQRLVARWAMNGGALRVNYRPGMVLNVSMDNAPALDSSLKWTQDLTLTLTAHEIPYWVDEVTTQKQINTYLKEDGTGNYGSEFGMIELPGMVERVPVDVAVTVRGPKALTWLYVRIANSFFELKGLSVPSGNTIIIGHSKGIVSIHSLQDTTESYLFARTPQSSDELLANPGNNHVTIEADTQVTAHLSGAGWYL